MTNLKLIKCQPRWRIAVIHWVARAVGVVVHVEGIPFGSRRNYRLPVSTGPNVAQHGVAIVANTPGALV